MKKKIYVANPNVGSAIEYMGDTIVGWLSELDVDIYDCKHQTRTSHVIQFIHNYSPDLIVINEYYFRNIVAATLYKAIFGTPIIYADHVWKRINKERKNSNESIFEFMFYQELLQDANYVFCLNYKPEDVEWNKLVRGKISNRYYATDPDVFKVTKPWEDRKMFCYIGNILSHKLSGDFLAKICETDLVVDCYGREPEGEDRYKITFDRAVEAGNIKYHGLIPQDRIAEVMNEYKYLVMPHSGHEPFNWVLKQCLHCGTIPVLTNDIDSQSYDGRWVHWAEGMYMGCKYTEDFISNLQQLDDERPDHSGISEHISQEVKRRFPYQEFKEEFQDKVRELLYG